MMMIVMIVMMNMITLHSIILIVLLGSGVGTDAAGATRGLQAAP